MGCGDNGDTSGSPSKLPLTAILMDLRNELKECCTQISQLQNKVEELSHQQQQHIQVNACNRLIDVISPDHLVSTTWTFAELVCNTVKSSMEEEQMKNQLFLSKVSQRNDQQCMKHLCNKMDLPQNLLTQYTLAYSNFLSNRINHYWLMQPQAGIQHESDKTWSMVN